MKQIPKIRLGLWLHLGLLALSVLIFLATFQMPMLSTPGFESANLYALILGPFFALAALCNTRGRSADFGLIFRRELGWLMLNLTLIFGLLFARSLAVKSCSLGSGIGTYFLILVPPLLLNLVLGSIIACLATRLELSFCYGFYFILVILLLRFIIGGTIRLLDFLAICLF